MASKSHSQHKRLPTHSTSSNWPSYALENTIHHSVTLSPDCANTEYFTRNWC